MVGALERRAALAWGLVAVYMALIWVISSLQLTPPVALSFAGRDKVLHAIEYAGLGVLVAHAAMRTWPDRHVARTAAVGAFVAASWGVLDELHQAFVPGRDADLLDIAADVLGGCAGAGARLLVRLRRGRLAGAA